MSETEVRAERHRFCPSCGTEAVTGASFCGRCGNSLIGSTGTAGIDPQQVEEPTSGTDIPSDNAVAPNAEMASGVLVSIATCPECGHQMRAEEPTHQSRGAMTCSSCGTKNLPYKWTWDRTTLPLPPQASEVAVPPTQPPAAGSVPPPLQTPPISSSGKKPLRRRLLFWIALGVVVLVIIAAISTAFSSSHSQAYQNGYDYGRLKSTYYSFRGQAYTAKYFCQGESETSVPVQNSDWVQGCAAALEAIDAGTTGTTGNSGPIGTSGNSGNT